MQATRSPILSRGITGAIRIGIGALVALVVALQIAAGPALAASRIKDITDFEGIRENMLVGYGIVVVLNGTFTSTEAPLVADRICDISVVSPDGIANLDTNAWSVRGDSSFLALRTGDAGTYVVGVSTRRRNLGHTGGSVQRVSGGGRHDGRPPGASA